MKEKRGKRVGEKESRKKEGEEEKEGEGKEEMKQLCHVVAYVRTYLPRL